MEQFLQVGIITSPHGIKGEVKVFPTTDDVVRFKKLKEVILEEKRSRRTVEIEQVKFFKNMVILKLKGIDSMNDAEKLRNTPLLVSRENAVKLKPGEYFICDLIGLQVSDEDGKFLGTLTEVIQTGANDVYVIKMENEKLHDDEIGDLVRTFDHMAKEIDKTRKLKEEFISSVSHELRTPLTSIKGWSETLGYEGISREELDLGLGIIQDETERLITLVEELLDFSRLASDRIRLQIDTVNVVKLAKDVVNQLGVKASEKNITLLTEFNTKEREIADIQGDKNRLKQVLINLVQNALKFTEEGGYVVVRLSQGDEYTTFSVVDNGIGIKQENLDKVLEKFFQEDYNKSGSGIGLAISNEIVKLHKGKLILESQKGEGTCITFTLKNNLMDAIAEEKM